MNHQEGEIKELKSSNVTLNDNVTLNNNLIALLRDKFEQVETKVAREIQALRNENEEMKQHLNRTGERIFAHVGRKFQRLEKNMKMDDDYESSEELIDVQVPEKAEEEDTDIFLQQE